MRKRWKTVVFAGIAVILVASVSGVALAGGPQWKSADGAGVGPAQTRGLRSGSGAAATAVGALSDYEKQALLYIREEEKLARDVYTALYAEWGITEFSTIAASESRHMASVKRLLDRYDLPDPVAVDTPGVFANDELQTAYERLVAQGTLSVAEAFRVGVTIEQLDIADLQELIDQTSRTDIGRVMQNLLRGSQNHLAAFTALLTD